MTAVMLAVADESGTIPEGKEYRIVLGSGQAIPAIEEVIMELTPGTTVERSVKWPDDFPDEAQHDVWSNNKFACIATSAAPTAADSVAVVMPNRITASTTTVRMPSGITDEVSSLMTSSRSESSLA